MAPPNGGGRDGADFARAYREVILFADGKEWPRICRHLGNSPGVKFQSGLAGHACQFRLMSPVAKEAKAKASFSKARKAKARKAKASQAQATKAQAPHAPPTAHPRPPLGPLSS